MRANKAKVQVEWRPEYEKPPSSADMSEFVPPTFAIPFPPLYDEELVVLIFVQEDGTIEVKDVEERIIVEDVDGWAMSSVAIGERSL